MSKRIVAQRRFTAETNYGYKVYYESDLREYTVRFLCDGEPLLGTSGTEEENEDDDACSYFTNDLDDAVATAESWLNQRWEDEMRVAVES